MLTVLLVTFLAISLIILLSLSELLQASLEEELQHVTEGVGRSVEQHLEYKTDAMDHALLSIMENADIVQAFAARDQQALLQSTRQIYGKLNEEYEISHFYFVLPNRETLLRVHHPDRRGDIIDRTSMREAEESGMRSSGIEMGPLGTFTLRVVKPWYQEGRLIGYVELGQEIDRFLRDVRPRSGTHFIWMIEKNLMNRAVWEEHLKSTGAKDNWNRLANHIVVGTTFDHIPEELTARENLFDTGKIHKQARIKIAGKPMLFTDIPIDQWRRPEMGHLSVLVDVSDIEQMYRASLLKELAWVLVAILGSLIAYYRVLGGVERTVVAAHDHLEDSINLRTAELLDSTGKLEIEIVERKRTEESLLQARKEADAASRAKSDFVAGMSHELRTPMNAVLGFAQILQADTRDPLTADQVERVGHILGAGNHLLELISEVLDLARIEAGQLDLSPEEVDVNEAIADCVALVTPLARPKGIRVIDEISQGTPMSLYTDPLRFRQVLFNLLSNAIKYNIDDGTVTIEGCELADNSFRISVKDTGSGIAEKDHDDLFKMFHRLGVDRGSEIEGSGIGLATTKVLVEKMTGQIGFESEKGVGSTFWIELPLASGESERIYSLS